MNSAKLIESIKDIIDDFLVFMGRMICFVIFNIIILAITCIMKNDMNWMSDSEQIKPFIYFFMIGSVLIVNIDKIKFIIKKLKGR